MMDRFREMDKLITNLETEVLRLINDSGKYREMHKEECDEIFPIARGVGSLLMSTCLTKHPAMVTTLDDLIPVIEAMFWIGYYLKAKGDVPEVYKKVFGKEEQ